MSIHNTYMFSCRNKKIIGGHPPFSGAMISHFPCCEITACVLDHTIALCV